MAWVSSKALPRCTKCWQEQHPNAPNASNYALVRKVTDSIGTPENIPWHGGIEVV